MKLTKVKSLKDNYIWILIDKNQCVIVDPGSFTPVQVFLKKKKINPICILITHHHKDHLNGVNKLKQKYKKIKIFGPKEINSIKKIYFIKNKENIKINNFSFHVFSTPGHTINHVIYYQKPYLFCGDTVFSGGCGKIFEGTNKQMYNSIKLIKNFPENTLICPSHEYTLKNIIFANSILPNDKKIKKYKKIIEKKIKEKKSTLPSSIKNEKKINIFFRTNDKQLKKKFKYNFNENDSSYKIFKKIRKMKDEF